MANTTLSGVQTFFKVFSGPHQNELHSQLELQKPELTWKW